MATVNYDLYTNSDEKTKFKEWREKVAGDTDSNMVRIDNALAGKQDELSGEAGQFVGFNEEGKAVPVPAPTGDLTQEIADGRYLQKTGGSIDEGAVFTLKSEPELEATPSVKLTLDAREPDVTLDSAPFLARVDGQTGGNRSEISMDSSGIHLFNGDIPPDPSESGTYYASLSLSSTGGAEQVASLEVQEHENRAAVDVSTGGVTLQVGEQNLVLDGEHITVTTPYAPDLQVMIDNRNENAAVFLNGDKIVTESEILSPYDYAVLGGFEGTEEEFNAVLGSGPWLPLSGGEMMENVSLPMDKGITSYVEVTGNKGTKMRFTGNAKIVVSEGCYVSYPGEYTAIHPETLITDAESFSYIRPNGFSVYGSVGFASNIYMNENFIRNLATPTLDYDAANKGYVDSAIQAAIDGALAAAY